MATRLLVADASPHVEEMVKNERLMLIGFILVETTLLAGLLLGIVSAIVNTSFWYAILLPMWGGAVMMVIASVRT